MLQVKLLPTWHIVHSLGVSHFIVLPKYSVNNNVWVRHYNITHNVHLMYLMVQGWKVAQTK